MLCPVHYIKKSAKTPVFLIKKSAKKRGKYRYNSGPKKTLRVYLRTTCTSGKGLYGHQRSTCELYRNMVSTRVCANNFFSVVQNGSAVVPGHYRAQLCNKLSWSTTLSSSIRNDQKKTWRWPSARLCPPKYYRLFLDTHLKCYTSSHMPVTTTTLRTGSVCLQTEVETTRRFPKQLAIIQVKVKVKG